MCLALAQFDSYPRAPEPLDWPTLSRIADAAAEHGVGILAGSTVEETDPAERDDTPAVDEGNEK